MLCSGQLYLLNTYGSSLGLKFSAIKLKMLKQWSESDPVSVWEIERNKRICKAQGSGNELIALCN
jgi:endonuclease I